MKKIVFREYYIKNVGQNHLTFNCDNNKYEDDDNSDDDKDDDDEYNSDGGSRFGLLGSV